ncbi:OLC1v1016324C1 [Oldenlandia corymbosa var. corymbosa]|uniref:OLC1v1016324C1 n=1 Tax=Oldenlandia corymbosa var. corymbosa TaxID=529605 RepID=A0AAV1E7F2_OLDCO|nr:OLC1v1016324C1 [Oldenlandia corymbosa var. corymbosa]
MSDTHSALSTLVTDSALIVSERKSAKVILVTNLVPNEANSENIYLALVAEETRCFAPSVSESVTSALRTHQMVASSDQMASPTHETLLTVAETDGNVSLVANHVDLVLMMTAVPYPVFAPSANDLLLPLM